MKRNLIIAAIVAIFALGIYSGYVIFKPAAEQKQKITSDIVLTALQQEGFFVTETYILDEKIEIEKTSGSQFKDFFFGQTLEARANVKVAVGVDLSKLTEKDIHVSLAAVSLLLPEISIQSTEIIGDVSLDNKQGILKKILDNEDGYNDAVDQLKAQARATANTGELRVEARTQTQKEITRLIRLIDPLRAVEIRYR